MWSWREAAFWTQWSFWASFYAALLLEGRPILVLWLKKYPDLGPADEAVPWFIGGSDFSLDLDLVEDLVLEVDLELLFLFAFFTLFSSASLALAMTKRGPGFGAFLTAIFESTVITIITSLLIKYKGVYGWAKIWARGYRKAGSEDGQGLFTGPLLLEGLDFLEALAFKTRCLAASLELVIDLPISGGQTALLNLNLDKT